MKTYTPLSRILLAPNANDEGGGGGTTVADKDGKQLGTLTEDSGGEEADSSKGTADEVVDVEELFGDMGGTKVVSDKSSTTKEGITSDKKEIVEEATEEATEKKTATEAKTAEKATEKKTAAEEKALPKTRDYTGIEGADLELVKKLPNDVFKHVAPILKREAAIKVQLKEATEKLAVIAKDPNRLPDNWYENENAYQLTPEFNTISTNYSRAETEGAHWEAQLIAIKGGAKTWQGLSYNSKTGQYSLTAEQEVTASTEVQLSQAMQEATRLRSKFQDDATRLQTNFKNQSATLNDYYKKADDNFNALSENLRPAKEDIDKFMAIVHPAHRGSSITTLAAKMFSVILRQGALIQTLNEKTTVEAKNKADQKAGGPANKTQSSSSSAKKKALEQEDEVDLNELTNEMQSET